MSRNASGRNVRGEITRHSGSNVARRRAARKLDVFTGSIIGTPFTQGSISLFFTTQRRLVAPIRVRFVTGGQITGRIAQIDILAIYSSRTNISQIFSACACFSSRPEECGRFRSTG